MRTFLIPPLCGDDDDLRALRARLSSCVELELVELPDAGAPGTVLSNMKKTADFVSSNIMRRTRTGDIGLVGFSFGGSTALEVAKQLVGSGYFISFLGILDGPFASSEMKGWFERFRRATSAKGSARTIANLAANSDVGRRTSWAVSSPGRIGQHRSDAIRRAMLAHVRGKALHSWVPEACDAEGVLVHTPTFGIANHQRWADLCPNLKTFIVDAEHEQLIRSGPVDEVVGILRHGIERITGGKSGDRELPQRSTILE